MFVSRAENREIFHSQIHAIHAVDFKFVIAFNFSLVHLLGQELRYK